MNVKGLTRYVKGSFSHNIAKMMMCTHANTNYDGHNTTCNDCRILLDTDIMTAAIYDALDAESHRIATEILDSKRAYTICNHTKKDIDGGTPFCIGCGLVFEDEIVYVNEQRDPDHCSDHYLLRKPTKGNTEGYTGGYAGGDTYHHPDHFPDHYVLRKPTKGNTRGNTRRSTPKRQNPEVPKTRPEPKEPEITPEITPEIIPEIIPKNVEDLITIAKSRGIKGCKSMSSKKLCEILKVEIVKPDKILFKNEDTGEELKFKTIYRAHKDMNVNPGSIQHHINSGKAITIGGTKYSIYKIQTDAE